MAGHPEPPRSSPAPSHPDRPEADPATPSPPDTHTDHDHPERSPSPYFPPAHSTSSATIEHRRTRILAAGVALLLFILYRLTAAPTFGFIDEGELAAAASTFGIAHPTGYPSFTILGGLFTALPWRDITELIFLVGLMTAIAGGLSVLVADRLMRRVERECPVKERLPEKVRSSIAAVTGLFVGSCGIWWSQGTGLEVYGLHAMMLALVTLLFLRWIEEPEDDRGRLITPRGLLFSIALGLAFTNHLTTILLAPAFLTLFALERAGGVRSGLRQIAGLIPGFLLGLLPYLYIPLRAAADPRFNWSNPEGWWGFRRHLTGAQYGDWMFTNAETFAAHTGWVFGLIGEQTLWLGLLLAVAGLVELMRATPSRLGGTLAVMLGLFGVLLAGLDAVATIIILFVALSILLGFVVVRKNCTLTSRTTLFLLLILAATMLYAGGYDIYDIESYYLAGIFAIGLMASFGLRLLARYLDGIIAPAIGLALVVAMIVVGYPDRDRSDLYLVEDAATAMLETVPENAVIISGLWDFWLSGSWYLQGAEGVRPDVAVLDHNLMKYGWYLEQLENAHPQLMADAADEVTAFREVGDRFERGLSYDNRVIDERYVAMIDAIAIRALERDRPVLVTFDVNVRSGNRFRYLAAFSPPQRRVPYGLGYLVNPSGSYVPQPFPDWTFRPPANNPPDGHRASLYQWYASSARDRGSYEAVHGNDSLAAAYITYALSFDPGWSVGQIGRQPRGMSERITEMIASFARMREMLGGR